MKSCLFIALFLSVGLFVNTTVAQPKPFPINVIISSRDKTVETEVESYITRELRTLGDVEPTEDPIAAFKLFISVLKTRNQGGNYTGYAVSYTFVEAFVCDKKSYFDLHDSGLETGDLESLRSVSSSIVTDVDSSFFKGRRKANEAAKKKTLKP